MGGLTLYAAGDDSNHAGKTGGEILVATFSILEGDDAIVKLGNKRNVERALRYVSEEGRDWRFTVRAGDQYRHYSQNVPFVLPTLIHHYLHSINGFLKERITEVCAFADGEVKRHEQERFIETIMHLPEAEYIERVSISGFVKKRFSRGSGFSKQYECPRLVWAADSIANHLFRKSSVEALFKHPKMIVPYIDK